MWKKLLLALITVLSLFICLISCATSKAKKYTEKEVEVLVEDGMAKTIVVRFYPDQPNVPYYGIRAYSEFAENNVLTCEKTVDGKLVFTNSRGVEAVVDPKRGTLSADDWTAFHNPALPYEKAMGFKDSDSRLVRITDVTSDEEPKSFVMDFSKHGLRMYAQEDDVYISLTLASSLFCDLATWHLTWSGDKARYFRFRDMETLDYDSPLIQELLAGGKRPHDVAQETYAELCFAFDYFYGHPGRAVLDDAIAQKGLNQALLDMGEKGEELIRGLKSTDGLEYLKAINNLFLYYLDDGSHTSLAEASEILETVLSEDRAKESESESFKRKMNIYSFTKFRKEIYVGYALEYVWGDEWYHEYGNTAVISTGKMELDDAGWNAFYSGEGPMPMDFVGIVATGLKRASENPAVRNVVFDFSANLGGYTDAVAFFLAITTGHTDLKGFDRTSGRVITIHYEADTNLDGVYDEKDKKTVYNQFNYGILTTEPTFSAGNYIAFLMRKNGAVVIGEPSGGGTCQVQIVSLPDGTSFYISSSQFSCDYESEDMEQGCPVDYPIQPIEVMLHDDGIDFPGYDYRGFFDAQMLNDFMNRSFTTI